MPYQVDVAGGYVVSDERSRIDLAAVHAFLSEESYWAKGRSRELVERSLAHSLCFGLYAPDGALAGFARLVTDYATTCHLQDVFVLPAHRGQGRGRAMVAAVLAHPELQGVRRWTLSTRDAHTLYARFGFAPFANPENQLARMVDGSAASSG
jgi:GNAT superfamily N-acetyltransferase